MNRTWDLFDPNRTELAISLQADSDSEGENNPGALTDE